ncbi:uncharacterized protein MONOS_9101 [Monocercomonoides exilis]|uniref:uncharacterized protein n=1 Tax=Monocercomonoides exilis TaxID=2049356 RepID=UPI00355AB7E7|nr:hypothetical protein MONOS_9101 [Monocercomonoides exilis]|eukprot:MONOS_9101.1-p1 / transcript=MONOS_9101.1 / gene=MONOS_9101 / organism=Monocercomonoides_exilis_PA203 / gene_product=unspecified product / transcript_product=unspecified product / location=Mono_scaffold00365:2347-7090(-) / protein_length=1141 / sequence_SO=supercontig / SO=protein_coding / is_pseudo=false
MTRIQIDRKPRLVDATNFGEKTKKAFIHAVKAVQSHRNIAKEKRLSKLLKEKKEIETDVIEMKHTKSLESPSAYCLVPSRVRNATLVAAVASDGFSLPTIVLWPSSNVPEELTPLQSPSLDLLSKPYYLEKFFGIERGCHSFVPHTTHISQPLDRGVIAVPISVISSSIEIPQSSTASFNREALADILPQALHSAFAPSVTKNAFDASDKAVSSEKGGAIFFTLGASGSMKMIDSTISHCSCNNSTGRGGGVYLATKERGELDFLFVGMKFSVNAAKAGNDIFIECFNITFLINERQFQFDFREKPNVGSSGVWGQRTSSIVADEHFTIYKEMTLDAQPMVVGGEVEMERVVVREEVNGEEAEVGGGVKECFVETKEIITFHSLMFCTWSFEGSTRTCWFMYIDEVLRFEGYWFITEAGALYLNVECLKGKGGKMVLVKCGFEKVATRGCGVIVADGCEMEVELEGVTIRNKRREDEGSVLELRRGKAVNIRNATMKKTNFGNGNEIGVLEEMGLEMRNSTLYEVRRYEGNGGMMSGKVGSGRAWEIEDCVFERCECEADYTLGGGIMVSVWDGGKFVFEHNKVDRCEAPSDSGKLGGVHVMFETAKIKCSMKMNEFTNNDAEKWKYVFLVCDSTWLVILPALWYGSATNETVQKKMWVAELTEAGKEDLIINYLFPRLGSNLFVSNAGNGLSSCGAKENSCLSVDIGFDRLKDETERIMLVGVASVSKTINRGGKGLTIKGNEETRELVVEEGGKFEWTEGDGQTHLTLSLLQISLPCSSSASASGDESIVEVRIGECFILDCLFSKGGVNSNVNECWKWIVIGNGGVIRIERTEMNGIRFEGCGIARFGGGNVIFVNCSLDGIETSGGGVIVGNGGSEVTLRNMTALGGVVGAGSLITSNGGSNLRIDGESRFEDIETESVSGGCVKSEMKLYDLLEIGSSSILTCSVNGNEGRGGGIYLDLSDNCVNNFALTTLFFKDNVAAYGRDLFISCKKLNETVMKERFVFEYKFENGEGEGMAVDMKGIDRDYFVESVDLELFLVEMKGIGVFVSREWHDTLGCGSDEYPCESMWSGISHIDMNEGEEERKEKAKDEGIIEDSYSFLKTLMIDGRMIDGDETKLKPIHFEVTINEKFHIMLF